MRFFPPCRTRIEQREKNKKRKWKRKEKKNNNDDTKTPFSSVRLLSTSSTMSGGLTDNEKVFVEALAGAIGGFAGAVAFYPLDTVKTRIQVRHIHTATPTDESTNAEQSSFFS